MHTCIFVKSIKAYKKIQMQKTVLYYNQNRVYKHDFYQRKIVYTVNETSLIIGTLQKIKIILNKRNRICLTF